KAEYSSSLRYRDSRKIAAGILRSESSKTVNEYVRYSISSSSEWLTILSRSRITLSFRPCSSSVNSKPIDSRSSAFRPRPTLNGRENETIAVVSKHRNLRNRTREYCFSNWHSSHKNVKAERAC